MALLQDTHGEVTHSHASPGPQQSLQTRNGSRDHPAGRHWGRGSQRRNGREVQSSDARRRDSNALGELSPNRDGIVRPYGRGQLYLVGAIVVAAAIGGATASAARGARVGAASAGREVRRVKNLNRVDAAFIVFAMAGMLRRLGKRELAR